LAAYETTTGAVDVVRLVYERFVAPERREAERPTSEHERARLLDAYRGFAPFAEGAGPANWTWTLRLESAGAVEATPQDREALRRFAADMAQGFPPPGDCRDWRAWLDREPPDPPRLHVAGTCTLPTPGYSVELRRHAPQGINPKDLLLDKVIHEPTGVNPQVLTDVAVSYAEQTESEFETVTILPDGPSLRIRPVNGGG
jgi:hypothetical protein